MKNLIITILITVEMTFIGGCFTRQLETRKDKEESLLYSAESAFKSGDYQTTVENLTELLKNRDTHLFVDALFLRAAAYIKVGEPKKAMDDYARLTLYHYGPGDPIVWFRIHSKCGDAFVSMKEYTKAAHAYSLPSLIKYEGNKSRWKSIDELNPDERREYLKLLEYSTFMAISCFNKENQKDKFAEMIDFYKREFPKGKYIDKLDNIPKPEECVNQTNY